MQEINQAYDMLMNNSGGGQSYSSQSGGYGSSDFMQVRRDIDNGISRRRNCTEQFIKQKRGVVLPKGVIASRKAGMMTR